MEGLSAYSRFFLKFLLEWIVLSVIASARGEYTVCTRTRSYLMMHCLESFI